jgi:hypothetical protein
MFKIKKMLKYRDYAPALKFGAKITPADLAGIVGQPVVGNIFYVDANNGSDSANSGTSPDNAFKTLGAAYTACTTYNYDVVIVMPTANSVTSEASIVWAKAGVTVIGAAAPTADAQRSRIGFGATATTPCLKITAPANRFINLKLVVEEDVNVLVEIASPRQYFANVSFSGSTNATTGDDTAARSLVIDDDCGENTFENCIFGNDTVLQSAANAVVEIVGTSTNARNQFIDCIFRAVCDNAGPRFVLFTGSYSAECFRLFKRCLFLNTRGGTTTMTVGMTVPASTNGKILMIDSWWLGCTDLADVVTSVYTNNYTPDTNDQGVLVVHANS